MTETSRTEYKGFVIITHDSGRCTIEGFYAASFPDIQTTKDVIDEWEKKAKK